MVNYLVSTIYYHGQDDQYDQDYQDDQDDDHHHLHDDDDIIISAKPKVEGCKGQRPCIAPKVKMMVKNMSIFYQRVSLPQIFFITFSSTCDLSSKNTDFTL